MDAAIELAQENPDWLVEVPAADRTFVITERFRLVPRPDGGGVTR